MKFGSTVLLFALLMNPPVTLAGSWLSTPVKNVEDSSTQDVGTQTEISSGLIGINFFEVFTQFDATKLGIDQTVMISDPSGMKVYFSYDAGSSFANISIGGLWGVSSVCIRLNQNFIINKVESFRHAEVALSLMKGTPGISLLARELGTVDCSEDEFQEKLADVKLKIESNQLSIGGGPGPSWWM